MYSDHLFRELFEIELEDDPKNKLDFDRWEPKQEDQKPISDFLMQSYWEILQDCGKEEAQEYIDLYQEIQRKGISECRDSIQEMFLLYFWAVDGNIKDYYIGDSDVLNLMQLTILKEGVIK